MEKNHIKVIGAGLAGCEAAWQAAQRGAAVDLYEMKPNKFSPAHKNSMFCELVCSNSLRSNDITNAVGLLKAELSRMDSLIMEAAYAAEVPAGSALAVDREMFSSYVTGKIENHPDINIFHEEVCSADPDEITIIATGPLTSDGMAEFLNSDLSLGNLSFYDAAAPIIDAESIDMSKAFLASRYGKGEACYLNCPMTKEQYDVFYQALVTAKQAPLHEFDRSPDEVKADENENVQVFEGCMPVEIMAKRGYDTLRFGPMKPVGLNNPETGEEYYAVVQLRQENVSKTMYNMVGFQTHLTFPEQKRVFSMIPGLENANFLRYGVMHRNTFLNSPEYLNADYSLRTCSGSGKIFFAGQMTGVEGYVESCSSGYVCAVNAVRAMRGGQPFIFPPTTETGALANYISTPSQAFQPMNANFGIIAPFEKKIRGSKADRNLAYAERALAEIDKIYQLTF